MKPLIGFRASTSSGKVCQCIGGNQCKKHWIQLIIKFGLEITQKKYPHSLCKVYICWSCYWQGFIDKFIFKTELILQKSPILDVLEGPKYGSALKCWYINKNFLSPASYDCNFETGLCHWASDNSFYGWQKVQARMLVNDIAEPHRDHTIPAGKLISHKIRVFSGQ